jgi:hypothetical protein
MEHIFTNKENSIKSCTKDPIKIYLFKPQRFIFKLSSCLHEKKPARTREELGLLPPSPILSILAGSVAL